MFKRKDFLIKDFNKKVTGYLKITFGLERTEIKTSLDNFHKYTAVLLIGEKIEIVKFDSLINNDLHDLNLADLKCIVFFDEDVPIGYSLEGDNFFELYRLKEYYFKKMEKKEDEKKLVNNSINISKPNEIKSEEVECIKRTKEDEIFKDVKFDLEYIFEVYPIEESLINIMPDSRFVRIEYSDDVFVIGIYFENSFAKYICYGFAGEFNKKPEIELERALRWFPLDYKKPTETGFWFLYQDATTGKILYE